MIYFLNKLFHWFLILIIIGCCSYNCSAQVDFNEKCLPQLADTCFRKLSKSLNCYNSIICEDPKTFCELLDDSLQCSADIISSDCSVKNGTARFDSWYKGFRSVYSYMCHPTKVNGSQETELPNFRNSECWNKQRFIDCVGNMLNIHHVVDMLNISYDYKECVRMMIAMISCNTISQHPSCDHGQFINNLLFLFFSEHKCNDFDVPEKTNGAMSLFGLLPLYPLVSVVMLLNRLQKDWP
ncbi:Hypothetical protein CINCED_3A007225 [Cinara cedri]|uniref:DUF19 domain-containing protein n=1 Tax=Cinara cedri TaxID=506608 RepID=A0A5E4MDU0_9HEMI|nr:Hypothetical protein CINCED_3A007225 [Cinara cedri]